MSSIKLQTLSLSAKWKASKDFFYNMLKQICKQMIFICH